MFPELERYASEFLCTYVDAEGTMRGTNLRWFRELRARHAPSDHGGGRHSQRARGAALEKLGMNAAVGMALYLDKLG